MDADPVARAVADNAAWCDLVCRAHGVPTRRDDRLWHTEAPSPPYYPDVVTLDPSVDVDAVRRAAPGARGVKDSFAVLPLDGEPMVEGEWWYAAPGEGPVGLPDGWTVAAGVEEQRAWARAHGTDGDLDWPAVAADPAVRLLLGPSAGGVLHDGGDAVGLSNVYGAWGEVLAAARGAAPGRALVGWESGDDLTAARDAGVVPTGPLRVWLL